MPIQNKYIRSFVTGATYTVTANNTYLTYLLTYLLTPWSIVLLEKLTGSAASQKIPCIF
jgi:hypothetical protein